MADYSPLSSGGDGGQPTEVTNTRTPARRLASLDAFRGLSIALMVFVDYAGSVFPFIAHAPWNGVRLADFVMPFFLFIAGVSLSLVYKKIPNRFHATRKAIVRAAKLFLLGILLQGGYFHGANSLSFGVDIEKLRWLGILQRISIGYVVAALCEIWSSGITPKDAGGGLLKNNSLHCSKTEGCGCTLYWIVMSLLSGVYLWLLYGLYVPDWQFEVQLPTSSSFSFSDGYVIKTVNCSVRGDLGPGCNSAGMIDRYVLGIEHLYRKPAYRNLKECQTFKGGQVLDNSASWCQAPFEPEGILGSLMASVTCIIGLHFGHILVQFEDHKERILRWLLYSLLMVSLGWALYFIGIPLNKQLYTISYMLITTASAGFTFCALYILIDVLGYRCPSYVLEWTGQHSLSIFVLIASNIAVIMIQGFYWRKPKNNIVHWIISLVKK